MGDWDGTCMVTQFAVLDREPCRLVFIRDLPGYKGHVGGGLCSPGDLWSPVSLALKGTFSSASSCCEGIDGNAWHVKNFQAWLDEALVECAGDREENRRAIQKPDALDLVNLQTLIHQDGRVLAEDGLSRSLARVYKDGSTSKTLLGAVLIREDVYQGLVGTPIEDFRGVMSRETLLAKLEGWYDGLCDSVREAVLAPGFKSTDVYRIAIRHERHLRGFWGFENDPLKDLQHALVNELSDRTGDVDGIRSDVQSTLVGIAEFLMLHRRLSSLRKSWAPQSGCGSNHHDDAFGPQELLLRVMVAATANMKDHLEEGSR